MHLFVSMDSFFHILLHSLIYILLFTSLGFFLGYKWYEKKAKQIEDNGELDINEKKEEEPEKEREIKITLKFLIKKILH